MRYSISTDLPHRVSTLNKYTTVDEDRFINDLQFKKGIVLCQSELMQRVEYYLNDWLLDRKKAIKVKIYLE